jgi:hypothetical protein
LAVIVPKSSQVNTSTPVTEVLGKPFSMITVLLKAGQLPLLIVQVKVLLPKAKPLTVAVALFTLLKLKPVPLQVPVPLLGTSAANTALDEHNNG